MGREENCQQISLVCVWGGGGLLALSQPHWVCPCSRHVCFPSLHCLDFRLLCRERALGCKHFPGLSCSGSESRVLHKDADSVEPAFCAIPQSDQLRRPDAWRVHTPQERCILSSPPVPAAWFLGTPISSMPCVSSGELISSCDPPCGCQPSRISGNLWLETGSLFTFW